MSSDFQSIIFSIAEMRNNIIFISGIDTDAGKSYATGWFAKKLMNEGKTVATLKFIQTGQPDGKSIDIDIHRKIMGVVLPEDSEGLTYPQVFNYPASPQLAARIDKRDINLDAIDHAIEVLSERYDIVLVEGAGGLMVPITDDFLTIDYPQSRHMPVALVTNGILGSINHTVLSLEVLKNRNIEVSHLLYNTYFDEDEIIVPDTKEFLKRYIAKHHNSCKWLEIPKL